MNIAMLRTPAMADHFTAFSAWLALREGVGVAKAARTINHYIAFFREMEDVFETPPSYLPLLRHFGSVRLRQVLLPILWMEATGLAQRDPAAMREDTECRLSDTLLSSVDSAQRDLLDGYRQGLLAKLEEDKTTWKSIRLALTPSVALLKAAASSNHAIPTQRNLDHYLRGSPGQRNALAGFVGYLTRNWAADLVLPGRDSAILVKAKERKREAAVVDIIRAYGMGPVDRIVWLNASLPYFHDRRFDSRMTVTEEPAQTGGGLTAKIRGRSYWVPWPPAFASRDPDHECAD
jgi:hypothetical protein